MQPLTLSAVQESRAFILATQSLTDMLRPLRTALTKLPADDDLRRFSDQNPLFAQSIDRILGTDKPEGPARTEILLAADILRSTLRSFPKRQDPILVAVRANISNLMFASTTDELCELAPRFREGFAASLYARLDEQLIKDKAQATADTTKLNPEQSGAYVLRELVKLIQHDGIPREPGLALLRHDRPTTKLISKMLARLENPASTSRGTLKGAAYYNKDLCAINKKLDGYSLYYHSAALAHGINDLAISRGALAMQLPASPDQSFLREGDPLTSKNCLHEFDQTFTLCRPLAAELSKEKYAVFNSRYSELEAALTEFRRKTYTTADAFRAGVRRILKVAIDLDLHHQFAPGVVEPVLRGLLSAQERPGGIAFNCFDKKQERNELIKSVVWTPLAPALAHWLVPSSYVLPSLLFAWGLASIANVVSTKVIRWVKSRNAYRQLAAENDLSPEQINYLKARFALTPRQKD